MDHYGDGPVGKRSNYDVLGSKVRAVLRTGPLAIRYSSILHCITWPITLCVSEWFIAQKLRTAWQTVGNEWAIVLYVLRLGLQFDTHSTHTGVFWGVTACNQLTRYRDMCTNMQEHAKHTSSTNISNCKGWSACSGSTHASLRCGDRTEVAHFGYLTGMWFWYLNFAAYSRTCT